MIKKKNGKGKFIGGVFQQAPCACDSPVQLKLYRKWPAMPILSSGSVSPGTFKRQPSSGMTVPLMESSLAPSVVATWMQHEERNGKLAAGRWHAGNHQQTAEHAPEGPSEACAAGSHGEHAALVLPEALMLANRGCEVPLQVAPLEAVCGHLFDMAVSPCKGERERKVVIAKTTGASCIADKT